MIEQDTIKLLRECDAGVKMGVASIEDVLDNVQAEPLRQKLADCKAAGIKYTCNSFYDKSDKFCFVMQCYSTGFN